MKGVSMAQISLAWVMAKDGELRMQYIFADIQIDVGCP